MHFPTKGYSLIYLYLTTQILFYVRFNFSFSQTYDVIKTIYYNIFSYSNLL